MRKWAQFLYRRPFFLLALFVLAAYLPVLLPFFHLKNDLLNQNLPTRYVFGESIYSGYAPYWNPFINYGIPQYGDMNNGFWNPLQWLIGSTTGYNIYTISFEELLYILIGGWGIYKSAKELFSKEVALVTALAYIGCGYLTGHMQYLCWITGTAFFPYILYYFLRVQKEPVLKNYLAGGISVFLFVAATHPGLIIGSGYFFAFLLLIVYFNRKGFAKNFYSRHFWQSSAIFLVIGCLLSIVVIRSNLEVLRYISRGSKVSLEDALMAPTSFQSYLSVFFPLPVHKGTYFATDIAMRNVYIGIAACGGLLFMARFINRRILLALFIPLLFFVLLAAGGAFKGFAWKFLPFLGFVRLNGEFTYFVILILLLGGAIGLQEMFKRNIYPVKFFQSLAILAGFTAVAGMIGSRDSILFERIDSSSFKTIIKNCIDKTSFWDLLFIQSAIQFASLWFIKNPGKHRARAFTAYCCNIALITWLTLPFTALGMESKHEVQSVINRFPRGIATQPLVAIKDAEYIKPADPKQFLLIASFSKKIGYTTADQYPVQLLNNEKFTGDSLLTRFINDQSYLFLAMDTSRGTTTTFDTAHIKVIRAGPGHISCDVNNDQYNWLVLLQNDYRYWNVNVDGKDSPHATAFETFIALRITKGEHRVDFQFCPAPIITAMWVNIGLLLLALALCAFPATANLRIFK